MPELELFVRTVRARAYPRLVVHVREFWWVFFDVFLPLVGLSSYVLVYRAIHAPERFVGFVILGGVMSAFWLNVLWGMGNQLFWEKETGNLGLYIMAPAPMMAILLGMALGGALGTSLRALTILTLGVFLFHVTFQVDQVALLLAVFVFSLVALYGMGMLFASLFLLMGREAWHMGNLAQEPVYLLSGTYFPISSFNSWVAAFASLIPLTLALDALRQLAFVDGKSVGLLEPSIEAVLLAGFGVVFIETARRLLAYMERIAVTEGRLTESRA